MKDKKEISIELLLKEFENTYAESGEEWLTAAMQDCNFCLL